MTDTVNQYDAYSNDDIRESISMLERRIHHIQQQIESRKTELDYRYSLKDRPNE